MKLPEFIKRLNSKELIELLDLLIHISRCGRLSQRNVNYYNEKTSKEYLVSLLRMLAEGEEKE